MCTHELTDVKMGKGLQSVRHEHQGVGGMAM